MPTSARCLIQHKISSGLQYSGTMWASSPTFYVLENERIKMVVPFGNIIMQALPATAIIHFSLFNIH